LNDNYTYTQPKHKYFISCQCVECENFFDSEIDPICKDCKPKESKKVKWYRPKVVWFKNDDYPTVNDDGATFRTKELAIDMYDEFDTKILEWQEIELSETWEQCESKE